MQAYQHLTAKGNQGAVTIAASNHNEKIVVLGASCIVTADHDDGPVSSFTVVPARDYEAVMVVIVNLKNDLIESLLLPISLQEGKASVELNKPFACAPGALGQLINHDNSCTLRVLEGANNFKAVWCADDLKQPVANKSESEKTFDAMCVALAKAAAPADKPVHQQN